MASEKPKAAKPRKTAIVAQPAREPDHSILAQPARELDGANLPQAVREIPRGHNTELMLMLKDPATRLWYARQTIANGWSRSMLVQAFVKLPELLSARGELAAKLDELERNLEETVYGQA